MMFDANEFIRTIIEPAKILCDKCKADMVVDDIFEAQGEIVCSACANWMADKEQHSKPEGQGKCVMTGEMMK